MNEAPTSDRLDKIHKPAALNRNNETDDTTIAVIGNRGCGKTSLIQCVVTEDRVDPEQFCMCRKIVYRDGRVMNFILRELPASDDHYCIRAQAYAGSQAVMVCFAVNDRLSFQDVPKWHLEVQGHVPEAKVFLIGCKLDTRMSEGCVSWEDGQAMAKYIGASQNHEFSATLGISIRELTSAVEEELAASPSHIQGLMNNLTLE